MNYNFDERLSREGTNSVKYDWRKKLFGSDDVLPMWVADMDLKTPSFIAEAIQRRSAHEIYGYTAKPDRLEEILSNWAGERYGWDIKKEWISYAPGVVPSLAVCLLAFTDPGDKIIVQPPVYPPFFTTVVKNNRRLALNPLKNNGGRYVMDFENLERLIDEKTKMIFLCNPHNPVGRVWTREELTQLAEICLSRNILIISDDIHADIVYKPNAYTPVASLSEAFADITLTCLAPSKSFNMAGLAASWVACSNAKLSAAYRKTLEALHIHYGHLFGWTGMEAAYAYGGEWLDSCLSYLKGNIDHAGEFVKNHIPELKMVQPEGTYLLWLDCAALRLNDRELRSFMIREARLGLNDGPAFGEEGSGFQRMNIGCPREILQDGLERLRTAVAGWRKKN